MEDRKGLFVVIEGTDGSGKGTQFKLLAEKLAAAGYDIATFDFPRYDEPSSYFVKQYLNGAYGSAEAVGPYTGSLFFSLDRYEAAPTIRQALSEGKIVLANRFTGSNMAHQGTKFAHAEERRGYFIWLDNLEFQMLNIPRPDQNIVLRVPAEIAQGLVDQKAARSYTDKKRDIHEADLGHLQRSVEVYDDLCQLFPKDFSRIDCVRGNKLLSIEEIHKILWEKIAPSLPPKKSAKAAKTPKPSVEYSADDVYVPTSLDSEMAIKYRQTMVELLEKRAELLERVGADSAAAAGLGWALLPVAASVGQHLGLQQVVEQHANAGLAGIAAAELPGTYAQSDDSPFALVDYWPRNELNTAPAMLYPYTSSSLRTITEAADSWPYDIKASILEAYAGNKDPTRLSNVGYVFDFVSDTDALFVLSQVPGVNVYHQGLTPRYGYAVPDLENDASEMFDDCFDLSTRLYSQLQTAGSKTEAQYATLLGHKVRVLAVMSDAAVQQLQTIDAAPGVRALIEKFSEAIAAVHPILSETRQT